MSQRHESPDPDPHQNVMDPEHYFLIFNLTKLSLGPYSNPRVKTAQLYIQYRAYILKVSRTNPSVQNDFKEPLARGPS
jgi:hypothetical protein